MALVMTAAAMIAADMVFAMMTVMMAAANVRIILKRSLCKCHRRRVRIARNAAVYLDAKAGKRHLSAAADAAADQRINALHHQHARQRAVSAAV